MSDYDATQQGYSVLYKGASGTGKTYNTLTWPGPIKMAVADKNMRTLRTAIHSGIEVDPVIITSWQDFVQKFLIPASNREFEASTLAIDTLDMIGILLQRDVQGPRNKLTQADWGTLLNRWIDAINQLTETTVNQGGKFYNVICTVHLRDITNDTGSLIKIAPAITGQFRDMLEGFFDWVLLCEAEIKVRKEGTETVYDSDYHVRTIPPSKFHTCKGGGLPPIVGGTHKSLMEAESKEF